MAGIWLLGAVWVFGQDGQIDADRYRQSLNRGSECVHDEAGVFTPEQKADLTRRIEAAWEADQGALVVAAENYPDLKANQNFIALQDELAGTENRINVERQRYNSAVQGYNTTIRRMPTALVARISGFQPRSPFEAAQGAETAPTVQF